MNIKRLRLKHTSSGLPSTPNGNTRSVYKQCASRLGRHGLSTYDLDPVY